MDLLHLFCGIFALYIVAWCARVAPTVQEGGPVQCLSAERSIACTENSNPKDDIVLSLLLVTTLLGGALTQNCPIGVHLQIR